MSGDRDPEMPILEKFLVLANTMNYYCKGENNII
jgi:hypothetical protein